MAHLILQSFTEEFAKYRTMAEAAMAQLDDAGFCRVIGDASVAMYANHVGGNLTSRFTNLLTEDGEKPNRNREGEFALPELTRIGSMANWATGWGMLTTALGELSDADLATAVRIRNQPMPVISALNRSLTHVGYHVGQIVLLAKIMRGPEWNSLSIPRGGSAAFNARMFGTTQPDSST